MKKILSSVLAASFLLGSAAAFVGCGGEGGEVIDKNKTQLLVSHFNGGYGNAWINEMKVQFEEAYKNVSFEEGKTGVQVRITDHKNTAINKNFDIAADDAYVFFNEAVPYNEFIDMNKIMDITDVVNGTFDINSVAGYEDVPDVEDKNIIGKFTDLQKTALNHGTESQAAYYAVPHYEGYYGFSYDAELFDKNGYYMYDDGSFGAYSDSDGLSTGPDGETGTYDDGMPNTYEDFFNLCALIADEGNVPIIFSGQYQFYITNVINALITDYNGLEEERLYYTFNGTTKSYVTGFNGNTPILGEKTITNANGYDVFKQAGYYYGFHFLHEMINQNDGTYLYDQCFTDGFSHTNAQNKFLLSARTSQADIAMIADGIWWTTEAAGTFATMEKNYPNSSAKDRQFKFMPLPKATEEEVGSGLTLLESQNSYAMVRKNMPEKYVPLAKLFVQFCNTEKSLKEFTMLSGLPRALNYEMKESELNTLTSFSKSVFEMKSDKNTQIAYQLSSNPLYADNTTKFNKYKSLAYSSYEFASKAMSEDSKVTAKSYFEGLANSWKTKWNDEFRAYL